MSKSEPCASICPRSSQYCSTTPSSSSPQSLMPQISEPTRRHGLFLPGCRTSRARSSSLCRRQDIRPGGPISGRRLERWRSWECLHDLDTVPWRSCRQRERGQRQSNETIPSKIDRSPPKTQKIAIIKNHRQILLICQKNGHKCKILCQRWYFLPK